MSAAVEADLSGKTCLVTGANAGIGKEIATQLARLGASVTMACRSRERGQAARDEVRRSTGNDAVELMLVDLSERESTLDFARRFRDEHPALHVLVNNAGIWLNDRRTNSADLELTFATNVLGYFLLTRELLDLLRSSAPARVVNVASDMAGKLDLDDLHFTRRRFRGTAAYSQSKQADRMLSWTLHERLEGSGVTVNAMHPGPVRTEIAADTSGLLGAGARVFFRLFGRTVERGADTAVWLAASPELEGVSGKYWLDRRERRCQFRDPAARAALWARCEELTSG
jgi:NAD(P)-dependent dehydrogenase (short-subunit alcohol dehydrogenase family)